MSYTFDTTVTVTEQRPVTVFRDAATFEELTPTGWACNRCGNAMLAPAAWSTDNLNNGDLVASLHEPGCAL